MNRKPKDAFPDQVRFAWGFWDGANAAEWRHQPLWRGLNPDRAFQAGWDAGQEAFKAAGKPADGAALVAWAEHQAAKKAAALARKAQRAARPDNRVVRV